MAVKRRERSSLNVYHVGLKGNNSQNVFFDSEDRLKFLQSLFLACEEFDTQISAWVLMNNHVHLLMHAELDDLPTVFKSISSSFVAWHHSKYESSGRMWGSRYHSRPILDEQDFSRTAAYIFNNPVRARIVENAEDYEWSNFKDVCMGYDDEAIAIMNGIESVEEIVHLTYETKGKDENDLDVFPKVKVSDDELTETLLAFVAKAEAASDLPEEEQSNLVQALFAKSASVNQVSRVTGISRRQVNKIVRL